MATTTVTLTSSQAARLDELVSAGQYPSAADALAHSIELLFSQTQASREYPPEVMAHIQKGLDQARREEFVPEKEMEAFFASWQDELEQ